MSGVTINPDATSSNTGALTGGASAHAVLSDSDDATYVTYDTDELSTVTFGSPSIPAGAIVKSYSLVVRGRSSSSLFPLSQITSVLLLDSAIAATSTQIVNWSSLAQWQALYHVDTVDADPETATVIVQSKTAVPLILSKIRLDVVYVVQPVVTVDSLGGTITDNNRPTVEWTPTLDTAGGPQTFGQVRWFSEAQYTAGGFDPDTSSSLTNDYVTDATTSIRSETTLVNGTYRAYVRVAQTVNGVGHFSDWDYEEVVIAVDTPGIPTLDPIAAPASGRIEINLYENPGAVDTSGYQIQRKVDGVWTDLRTTLGAGRTNLATFYDYETPAGTAEYRARALHDFVSGTESASEWITAAESLELTQWWLTNPYHPSRSVGVDLRSFPSQSRAGNVTVLQPLGSTTAVAIYGDRGVQTGTVVIRASDDSTRDAVMALGSARVPLYMRPPLDHHEPARWVVLQDEDIERVIDHSWSAERNLTYGWTVVDRPTGDVVALATSTYPSPDLFPASDLYPS